MLRRDDCRLCKAWYENRIYGTGRRTLSFSWGVHPLELKYLEQLWSELRYTREEYRKLLTETQVTWQFDVDEQHEEIVIWLDDRALEDIVLVALEAYAVPKGRGSRYTETYGICFGSTKSTEEKRQAHGRHTVRYIHINSVHIQLRAEGYSSRITYDVRSLETQMEVAKQLFPQLDIVGDFHTHPYRDVDEIKRIKGWQFSRDDEINIPEWVLAAAQDGLPAEGVADRRHRQGRQAHGPPEPGQAQRHSLLRGQVPLLSLRLPDHRRQVLRQPHHPQLHRPPRPLKSGDTIPISLDNR